MQPNCNEDYLDETGRRRRVKRTADHSVKDKQFHLLKHALINNHPLKDLKDCKVIDRKLPWKQLPEKDIRGFIY